MIKQYNCGYMYEYVSNIIFELINSSQIESDGFKDSLIKSDQWFNVYVTSTNTVKRTAVCRLELYTAF